MSTMNTGSTTVVVVGAGVAGLALGNFLLRNDIDCIVLEKHTRGYVEGRQRAGALDGDAVAVLREWGLAEAAQSYAAQAIEAEGMPLRVDGQLRHWRNYVDDGGEDGIFCPQQILVQNLIRTFLRDGGDLRFGVDVITFAGLDGEQATVCYRDAAGETTLSCAVVAGCDGDHGVSRTAIPADVLDTYAIEHGYAWLALLADVAPDTPGVMAIHERGFAAQITRGERTSRFYLQVPLTDTLDDWPDERIWTELAVRFGEPAPARGPITDRQLVPLRSVVHSPMSHGRLYLLGDAAHLISPMSAKGMSLALYDADLLARAILRYAHTGDTGPLDAYSETALRHIWAAQKFGVTVTELMHNAGDASHAGEFRKQLARAELATMID